jgi:hypothetical protein
MSPGSGHVAPSRVVAAMAHNPNVRKGETNDDAVKLHLTKSGVGCSVLQHLRSLGYEVSAINPRHGMVRCLPVSSSVIAPDHDSTAIKYHRHRLQRGGAD